MDLHDVKKHLQNHLSDGLVVVIGSGLSCAEGMPGMGALADHLLTEVPECLDKEKDKAIWGLVASKLSAGVDLESTLLEVQVSELLEEKIANITHAFILRHEQQIISDVFLGDRVLRFSRLLPHLLKPKMGIPVVTTNYDRLVEVAAECVGIAVNDSFSGKHVGSFNPRESKLSLCRSVTQRGKKVLLKYADHLSVYKPHGSLDWFRVNNEPVSSNIFLGGEKLIITPGANKFRGGYERPFDSHREMANKAIDGASRFLIIGYGFNDEHLQVHLERQIDKGRPTVVITHSITTEFRGYLRGKPSVWVVCSRPEEKGFTLIADESEIEFDDINIWDLDEFVSEVLE
tara:strand:+ start:642 stop:1676 length:1035 start_codon:yes stop_codon:yes gene_type:complete